MQDMYNLVYREEEKEMHPMLLDQGVACTPFSSLAHGVSTSVIAQAWNLANPVVTSPLVGASKTKYIDDAIAALDLKLTAEEMAYLEEPYAPHAQYGFR